MSVLTVQNFPVTHDLGVLALEISKIKNSSYHDDTSMLKMNNTANTKDRSHFHHNLLVVHMHVRGNIVTNLKDCVVADPPFIAAYQNNQYTVHDTNALAVLLVENRSHFSDRSLGLADDMYLKSVRQVIYDELHDVRAFDTVHDSDPHLCHATTSNRGTALRRVDFVTHYFTLTF